ncbi:hypothetical protein MTR67_014047, partial [Solanum verrucosum]
MAEMVDNALLVLPALLAPRAPTSPLLLNPSKFLLYQVFDFLPHWYLLVYYTVSEFCGVFRFLHFDVIWLSGYSYS